MKCNELINQFHGNQFQDHLLGVCNSKNGKASLDSIVSCLNKLKERKWSWKKNTFTLSKIISSPILIRSPSVLTLNLGMILNQQAKLIKDLYFEKINFWKKNEKMNQLLELSGERPTDKFKISNLAASEGLTET